MITEKEMKVYRYLVFYIKQNLYAPTTDEICKATGIKSKSTVNGLLKSLQEKGYIEMKPNSSRAIKINGYEFRREETVKSDSPT